MVCQPWSQLCVNLGPVVCQPWSQLCVNLGLSCVSTLVWVVCQPWSWKELSPKWPLLPSGQPSLLATVSPLPTLPDAKNNNMDDEELYQTITQFFLSTRNLDASVSLKTWWGDDKKLRFFVTNAPPRRPIHSSTGMPTRTLNRNIIRHSSPEVVRSDNIAKDRPNISTIESERDMSHENFFAETRIENEHDSSDVEMIAVPNVSTKNRFDVLVPTVKPKLTKEPESPSTPAVLTSTMTSTPTTTMTPTGTLQTADPTPNKQTESSYAQTDSMNPYILCCNIQCREKGSGNNFRSYLCKDCFIEEYKKNPTGIQPCVYDDKEFLLKRPLYTLCPLKWLLV